MLVILTDMTNYCESLREVGTARGEIPGRKGYPGYLYSDLASLYERAGRIEGSPGSITQMPILTMPNDDISHPVPDLTGYITEGQIVLDRELFQRGIYPPIAGLPQPVAPDEGRRRQGLHARGPPRPGQPALRLLRAGQAASAPWPTSSARRNSSALDKQYLKFGEAFEHRFLNQGEYENRSIETTLDLGWDVLSLLPRDELHRVSDALLDAHYRETASRAGATQPRRHAWRTATMAKLNVAPTKSSLPDA